jgi:hypothetical protein
VGSISHISGVNLPKSQSKMIADFEAAGYPTKLVVQGTAILEVPPQNGVIPKAILDSANKAGVLIRDTNGKVY